MKYSLIVVTLLSLLGALTSCLNTAQAQGTAFTYQGRLSNGGSPISGSYDLSFTLYSDASSAVVLKGPVTNSAVVVTNGLFTTLVDFGPGVFVGGSNWLGIAVSPSGSNSFSLLSPRQQVTPTPYALNVVGPVNASQLSGSIPATSISGVLTLAQLPAGVVTNGAASLTLGGTNPVAPLTLPPTIPVGAVGSAATGVEPHSVAVAGRYAYVVNYSPTLQVFDVSNPSAPSRVGSVATGIQPTSVAMAGRYAYVVNGGANTLQVFDVSNPSAPNSVGSVSTGNVPHSVAVAGRYAYVVNAGDNTLQVFDVSNPAGPSVVGLVSTGSNPYALAVSGRYAYVANYGASTLQVFDVSNPSAPASVGSVGTGNAPISVVVAGRYAYVANYGASTLQVFDLSNPSAPSVVGSVSTGGYPYALAVAGRYAYVVNAGDNTLQVFDVSNPTAPRSVGSVSTGSNPFSVAVAGRYAYVANFSDNTLQVFDLGGAYLHELEAGAIETGTLQTRDTATIGNNLDVRGGLTVSGSARISGGLGVDSISASNYTGNGAGLTNIPASGIGGAFTTAQLPAGVALLNGVNTFNGNQSIMNNGRIGIGTTSPSAPLDVEIVASASHGNWGYLTFSGYANNIGLGYLTPVNLAIYTPYAVGAQTYYAFSDARIKNITGVSDSAADLKSLLGIQVTDYTYKDAVAHGSRPAKKVIAQQVESVYPQAVSRMTGVIPDIYKQVSHHDGWIPLEANLKVGERVKLIGEGDQGIYEVLETREGAFRTAFRPATEKVFVYGREVQDFRNVDYEALAMLNVSATQELARRQEAEKTELSHQLEAQREQVQKLESKLTQALEEKAALLKYLSQLEARDQAREERLTRIESNLEKGASGVKYASFPK
jgi:hypothetical protein